MPVQVDVDQRHVVRSAKFHRLAYFARKHIGKPYRYGARPSEAPNVFDCSSFVQYLYRRVEIELPRTSIGQAKCGRVVKRPTSAQLQVGDLLFFTGSVGRYDEDFPEGIGHDAMYIGDGKIVHARYAERTGGSVRLESASVWLHRKDLVVVRRFLK